MKLKKGIKKAKKFSHIYWIAADKDGIIGFSEEPKFNMDSYNKNEWVVDFGYVEYIGKYTGSKEFKNTLRAVN